MPRTDNSVAIPTGMIVAALYVILLVGFSRESYMRRDAAHRVDADSGATIVDDVSKRVCRIERPICPGAIAAINARQSCVASFDAVWQFIGGPSAPLTLDGLRQAIRMQER